MLRLLHRRSDVVSGLVLVLATALAVVGLVVPAAAQTNEPTRIVAVGDSITLGLRDTGVQCSRPGTFAGYPRDLASRLAGMGEIVSIEYSAFCGDTVAGVLARLDSVLATDPAIVVVKIGTNDFSGGMGFESLFVSLQEIAARIEAAGSVPVLSSIIPYGWEVRNRTRLNGRAGALADVLRQHAGETGRALADPFDRFVRTPSIFDRYYDDDGYHPNPAGYDLLTETFVAPTLQALDASRSPTCVQERCIADEDTLCLLDARYAVEVHWRLQDGGPNGEPLEGVGRGSTLGDTTGRFWFFDPENLELLVKVLDGRCVNGHIWVYFGALSDVEFELSVRDQATCTVATYRNEPGVFASRGDSTAFAVPCPTGPF